jgi:MoaA/NifB/PqqE/SkfB family radical SAM enzyme
MKADRNLGPPNEPWELPCSFYDNCIVMANGDLHLCCVSRLIFGNVKDKPLEEIWRIRCENKMRNPDCESCEFRSAYWREALEA